MIRIFFFLFGFGLMTIGLTYIILYLNLLSIEYNFLEYVNFISRRPEIYLSLLGFIIINLTIFIKGDKRNGIYIWHNIKLS